MEWYRVRFAVTRHIVFWLLLETIFLFAFPSLLELNYGLRQNETISNLIIFFYSVALFYVLVLSKGFRWYLALCDKELKRDYLPLLRKSKIKHIDLSTEQAVIFYCDGNSSVYSFSGNNRSKAGHIIDFTVYWIHRKYMPKVLLRDFCQYCVLPTDLPCELHSADLLQKFRLFVSQEEKDALKHLTVYTGHGGSFS